MNYAETFDQFATRVSPTDLALYAGAGLILFVLFKDKLSPVQQYLTTVFNKIKDDSSKTVNIPEIKSIISSSNKEDVFFKLVVSWKQTRDLAEESGCQQAVKVADQMFPFLSPVVCSSKTDEVTK